MIILHHKTRTGTGEERFFQRLAAKVSTFRHVDAPYAIDPKLLDVEVETAVLRSALEADIHLPPKRRGRCLDLLATCPEALRVAQRPSDIEPDVVGEVDGTPYRWEFHEHQHRDLSVSRLAPVYSSAGQRIEVPRYFQRLVRDVWSVLAFPNFTIVWWDWFAANPGFSPELRSGLREHSLPDRFSFFHLLNR